MDNLEGKLFHYGSNILIKVIKESESQLLVDWYAIDLKKVALEKQEMVSISRMRWDKTLNAVEVDEDVAQGILIGIFEASN